MKSAPRSASPRAVLTRIRAPLKRRPLDDEFADEINAHLEMATGWRPAPRSLRLGRSSSRSPPS